MNNFFNNIYEKALSQNNPYFKSFVENKATKEQLEYIEIATGILSFCSMSLAMDYTDDEHLSLITEAIIELNDDEFVNKLRAVETFEDYKNIAIPDNDVLERYISDGQNGSGKGFLFAE